MLLMVLFQLLPWHYIFNYTIHNCFIYRMTWFFYCITSLEKLKRPSHKIFTEFLLNVKYYIKGTIGHRKITSFEHNHIQVMETRSTKFLNIQKQIKTIPSNWSELCTWMEKERATHSSILAWRILWTEEPGRL